MKGDGGTESGSGSLPGMGKSGSEGAAAKDRKAGETRTLFLTALVVLAGMSVYDLFNTFLFPQVSLWGMHVGTIIVGALTAVFTTHFFIGRHRALVRMNREEAGGRIRAENALRESEELYSLLIEKVGDGITIVVDSDRVFANPAFLAMHGLKDPALVIGQPFDQFIIPEDRETVKERVRARLKGESPGKMAEYRILRPDGEVRTLQASVEGMRYKGQPATLAVLRDITEAKRAETEIRELNNRLERHVRDLEIANNDLETFNSTVSHDLRNPLIAIQGFSGRMAERLMEAPDKKCGDYVNIIRTNAERMEQLIDDLLSYSRLGKQALQHRVIPMQDLVNTVLGELTALFPGGVLTVSPLPDALGDEHMVRQVVVNLLANALKFSGRREKRVIEVAGRREEEMNVYSVRDNGVGFDMAYGEKMFEIFQRLHGPEEFEGTGIGLAIVKRIVMLHGGRVWAEGEPDRGATFYFTLPAAVRA